MKKNFETLLAIIVKDLNREYLEEQQMSLCKNICSDILKGTINPNQINHKTVRIVYEDNNNYFISMKTKKGIDITVPVSKETIYTKNLSSRLYIKRD